MAMGQTPIWESNGLLLDENGRNNDVNSEKSDLKWIKNARRAGKMSKLTQALGKGLF